MAIPRPLVAALAEQLAGEKEPLASPSIALAQLAAASSRPNEPLPDDVAPLSRSERDEIEVAIASAVYAQFHAAQGELIQNSFGEDSSNMWSQYQQALDHIVVHGGGNSAMQSTSSGRSVDGLKSRSLHPSNQAIDRSLRAVRQVRINAALAAKASEGAGSQASTWPVDCAIATAQCHDLFQRVVQRRWLLGNVADESEPAVEGGIREANADAIVLDGALRAVAEVAAEFVVRRYSVAAVSLPRDSASSNGALFVDVNRESSGVIGWAKRPAFLFAEKSDKAGPESAPPPATFCSISERAVHFGGFVVHIWASPSAGRRYLAVSQAALHGAWNVGELQGVPPSAPWATVLRVYGVTVTATALCPAPVPEKPRDPPLADEESWKLHRETPMAHGTVASLVHMLTGGSPAMTVAATLAKRMKHVLARLCQDGRVYVFHTRLSTGAVLQAASDIAEPNAARRLAGTLAEDLGASILHVKFEAKQSAVSEATGFAIRAAATRIERTLAMTATATAATSGTTAASPLTLSSSSPLFAFAAPTSLAATIDDGLVPLVERRQQSIPARQLGELMASCSSDAARAAVVSEMGARVCAEIVAAFAATTSALELSASVDGGRAVGAKECIEHALRALLPILRLDDGVDGPDEPDDADPERAEAAARVAATWTEVVLPLVALKFGCRAVLQQSGEAPADASESAFALAERIAKGSVLGVPAMGWIVDGNAIEAVISMKLGCRGGGDGGEDRAAALDDVSQVPFGASWGAFVKQQRSSMTIIRKTKPGSLKFINMPAGHGGAGAGSSTVSGGTGSFLDPAALRGWLIDLLATHNFQRAFDASVGKSGVSVVARVADSELGAWGACRVVCAAALAVIAREPDDDDGHRLAEQFPADCVGATKAIGDVSSPPARNAEIGPSTAISLHRVAPQLTDVDVLLLGELFFETAMHFTGRHKDDRRHARNLIVSDLLLPIALWLQQRIFANPPDAPLIGDLPLRLTDLAATLQTLLGQPVHGRLANRAQRISDADAASPPSASPAAHTAFSAIHSKESSNVALVMSGKVAEGVRRQAELVRWAAMSLAVDGAASADATLTRDIVVANYFVFCTIALTNAHVEMFQAEAASSSSAFFNAVTLFQRMLRGTRVRWECGAFYAKRCATLRVALKVRNQLQHIAFSVRLLQRSGRAMATRVREFVAFREKKALEARTRLAALCQPIGWAFFARERLYAEWTLSRLQRVGRGYVVRYQQFVVRAASKITAVFSAYRERSLDLFPRYHRWIWDLRAKDVQAFTRAYDTRRFMGHLRIRVHNERKAAALLTRIGRGRIARRRLNTAMRTLARYFAAFRVRLIMGFRYRAEQQREARRQFEKLLAGDGWAAYQALLQQNAELNEEIEELNFTLDRELANRKVEMLAGGSSATLAVINARRMAEKEGRSSPPNGADGGVSDKRHSPTNGGGGASGALSVSRASAVRAVTRFQKNDALLVSPQKAPSGGGSHKNPPTDGPPSTGAATAPNDAPPAANHQHGSSDKTPRAQRVPAPGGNALEQHLRGDDGTALKPLDADEFGDPVTFTRSTSTVALASVLRHGPGRIGKRSLMGGQLKMIKVNGRQTVMVMASPENDDLGPMELSVKYSKVSPLRAGPRSDGSPSSTFRGGASTFNAIAGSESDVMSPATAASGSAHDDANDAPILTVTDESATRRRAKTMDERMAELERSNVELRERNLQFVVRAKYALHDAQKAADLHGRIQRCDEALVDLQAENKELEMQYQRQNMLLETVNAQHNSDSKLRAAHTDEMARLEIQIKQEREQMKADEKLLIVAERKLAIVEAKIATQVEHEIERCDFPENLKERIRLCDRIITKLKFMVSVAEHEAKAADHLLQCKTLVREARQKERSMSLGAASASPNASVSHSNKPRRSLSPTVASGGAGANRRPVWMSQDGPDLWSTPQPQRRGGGGARGGAAAAAKPHHLQPLEAFASPTKAGPDGAATPQPSPPAKLLHDEKQQRSLEGVEKGRRTRIELQEAVAIGDLTDYFRKATVLRRLGALPNPNRLLDRYLVRFRSKVLTKSADTQLAPPKHSVAIPPLPSNAATGVEGLQPAADRAGADEVVCVDDFCAAEVPTAAAEDNVALRDDEEVIEFYRADGPHGYLANFAAYGFTLEGTRFATVEHYFQAMKFAHSPADFAFVAEQCATPKEAAAAGRDRSRPLRADWDDVKDAVMYQGLVGKFAQNPELRARLLATGERTLVDRSGTDAYWGSGADGKGLNKLGRLLMRVRSKLRPAEVVAPAAAEHQSSQPPASSRTSRRSSHLSDAARTPISSRDSRDSRVRSQSRSVDSRQRSPPSSTSTSSSSRPTSAEPIR